MRLPKKAEIHDIYDAWSISDRNVFSTTMPRIKHVFLFRHCVRSVDDEIKFYDTSPNNSENNDSKSTFSPDPFDYLPKWPVWNTPPEWCTAGGAHIVKGTGAFLLKQYLINNGSGDQGKTIRVAFVSDKTPRDVQTALAMMTGMAEEIVTQTNQQKTSPDYQLQGLDTIEIDPPLFHPFERNGFRSEISQDNVVCETPTIEDRRQSIEQRLRTLPPPSSFLDIMTWMKAQTGVNVFQVFEKKDPNHTMVTLAPDGEHFEGAWNLVKYVAQSVFYARASGITGDYWKNITMDELYELVAWIHWSRNVQNVGNNMAAANGGVLVARILHALRTDHHDATFIIGHDSDLDAVATAMGISWDLPSPYRPGYKPTPPGSGIHFAFDGTKIEISFMAPIYFSNQALHLNATGILVEVPVKFDNFSAETRGDTVTIVPTFHALRDHILVVLGSYRGSIECFEAAEKIWSPDRFSSKGIPNRRGSIVLLLGCLLLGCAIFAFVCICHRRRSQGDGSKRGSGIQRYTGMPPCSGDLELT